MKHVIALIDNASVETALNNLSEADFQAKIATPQQLATLTKNASHTLSPDSAHQAIVVTCSPETVSSAQEMLNDYHPQKIMLV